MLRNVFAFARRRAMSTDATSPPWNLVKLVKEHGPLFSIATAISGGVLTFMFKTTIELRTIRTEMANDRAEMAKDLGAIRMEMAQDRIELAKQFGAIRSEMAHDRTELKLAPGKQMVAIRTEMAQDRAELAKQLGAIRVDIMGKESSVLI